MTVLFADLTGSTALIADRDPEEARKLLDPVLEIMMESVHRYEGIVNQVMGDGIMAIFGAPLAHEDHAVRACYAALAMQSTIRRHGDEVRRSHGATVQIRVGLNSGDVLVGAIGTDLRMDYAAVGQTTHLAARMEQLAAPGSILLTAETLRLAEGFVQVTPLGPVPVKGIPEPVEAFEVSGAVPVRTRLQAAASRGLTRFVGRQTELQVLGQALNHAAEGHGQLVALVGEPGVGKSRLFWEFTHSHRTRGWLILESGSVSYGKATPYFPVINLLKAYFQIEQHDDGRKIREKLTGKLLTLDKATLEPTLPALFALLDASVEDPEWQALDSLQRRQRTLDAVKRLLLRESQVQPLILILEDLHWIDSETQSLLDSIVESLSTSRVLLLVNYRPEYQHGWGTKTSYTQLRVDTLPPEGAEELLRALLGEDRDLQPLKELLINRTEGNPFFLEESVRTLVETRALVGERGAYRLTKPLPSIQVPATVQAVLAARIDRLPAEEKRLLQTAAVIGKDVLFSLLQATAELPEEALRSALAHLQDAEFLYETSLFPDLRYSFKHALTHEVTYGSIVQDRRRALHARIVEAIEALYTERLDDQVDRLAHHALRAERWEKAVAYLHQAGARALDRSANAEAGVLLEQALGAFGHLPESSERLELAIDLRLDIRRAVWPLGKLDRVSELLREAEALAQTLGDHRRLGLILVFLANHFCLAGDPDRAIESATRAVSIATALQDLTIRLSAQGTLGWAYLTMGDYRRSAEVYRE
ncbi:MAG: ATP-binding protein, partial [Candidatus Methylomirabilaceae bacterium]